MQKIPTLFLRDPGKNLKYLLDEVNPLCLWVLEGEGVATRKYDGTCCLIKDGHFYKRREVKDPKPLPSNFIVCQFDPITKKHFGWVPVTGAAEDKFHREAINHQPNLADGTYELIGPKVQGNPEAVESHVLVSHADAEVLENAPRSFEGLQNYLRDFPYEGIVWHHPDGRMAKIKRKDFER